MIDKLIKIKGGIVALARLAVFLMRSPSVIPQIQQVTQQVAWLQQVMEQTHRNVSAISLALTDLNLGSGPIRRKNPDVPIPSKPHDTTPLRSCLCTMDQFLKPAYGYWCRRIGEEFMWNRKQWEFCYIAQALWERGFLRKGMLGIGFGVGREPLSALFASEGCTIVATDAPEETPFVPEWKSTDQYARSLNDLNEKGLCVPEEFHRLVTFRFVDMNAIPYDLPVADFVWSCCSAEHIGSIDKTKDFFVKCMKCLKPGGLAVHTTEFNVSSDEETLEIPALALLRKKDILDIEQRLTAAGHLVAPLDFDPGSGILDRVVDCLPHNPDPEPHLKLFLNGFVATSIGLIVEKASEYDQLYSKP